MPRTVNGFTQGDRVEIVSHALSFYVGRRGVVKVITEAATIKPTAWVSFEDYKGGIFALLSDLVHMRDEEEG